MKNDRFMFYKPDRKPYSAYLLGCILFLSGVGVGVFVVPRLFG